jgi:hypothetical protein
MMLQQVKANPKCGGETPVKTNLGEKTSLVSLLYYYVFLLMFTDFILNLHFILSFDYEKIVSIATYLIQLESVQYN